LLKVKNGEYPYERDSVVFSKLLLFFPLLSSLFYVALKNNKYLNLIDFGGSLGSTYFQNKNILKQADIKINWNIVEQSHFVACGMENFYNDELRFYYTIDNVLQKTKVNVCLLSGVLQYLEQPFEIFNDIYNSEIEYVIIDRTSFVQNENDILTIQNVYKEIYEAEYPAWFFSLDKFHNYINKKYSIIYQWDAFDNYTLKKRNVKALGYLLKRLK
jgi:putative methyltransferase (TIGR04325 family)